MIKLDSVGSGKVDDLVVGSSATAPKGPSVMAEFLSRYDAMGGMVAGLAALRMCSRPV